MASDITFLETFPYEDLRTTAIATFPRNPSSVSEWLGTYASGDDVNLTEWIGRLLTVAAYHHSVDVAKCIINYIKPLDNRKGEQIS